MKGKKSRPEPYVVCLLQKLPSIIEQGNICVWLPPHELLKRSHTMKKCWVCCCQWSFSLLFSALSWNLDLTRPRLREHQKLRRCKKVHNQTHDTKDQFLHQQRFRKMTNMSTENSITGQTEQELKYLYPCSRVRTPNKLTLRITFLYINKWLNQQPNILMWSLKHDLMLYSYYNTIIQKQKDDKWCWQQNIKGKSS